MQSFEDKVVVITGSANGLGKALALEFYGQGAHLALIDVDLAGLEILHRDLNKGKRIISIYKTDISDEKEILSVQKQIVERFGRIDVLVNNAAISLSQPFDLVEQADFRRLFDINFWGTVYCCRHFLPELKKQKDSRLVNIIVTSL